VAPVPLIEELTGRTGESAEAVVAAALRERLGRLRNAEEETQRGAAVYALVNELATIVKESLPMVMDHGALFYGEDGLPR
jgi:hypothetical protein